MLRQGLQEGGDLEYNAVDQPLQEALRESVRRENV